MSNFGKSIYYQTAIERHREMFIEDCAKMVERVQSAAINAAPTPTREPEGTIQAMEY